MITKQDAMTEREFYHVKERNADGSAVRCRANGACKTWKTRPEDYRLPVKYGLRHCFYLTPANAHEWSTVDPTAEKRERAHKEKQRAQMKKKLGMASDTPLPILHDAMLDAGMSETLARIVCL